ncbi:hypothetical protein POSPLADRAFT_1085470, partial [Postia placenta MAD-698-R-SB12]
MHLPIYRRVTSNLDKRTGQSVAIGLGDDMDITYNVLISVGSTQTALVLDTGSSDLWLVSDACTGQCNDAGVPLYSQETLHPTGLDVRLLYGDSRTGTHATGPVGSDTVSIASLSIVNQSLAAINDTNTTVFETGSAGILGLGFPPISMIWRELLQAQLAPASSQLTKRSSNTSNPILTSSIGAPPFPSFDFLKPGSSSRRKRQSDAAAVQFSSAAIASFATYGPLLPRLIVQNMLSSPLIAITLQRDTFDIGGNVGLLSVGALPVGIQDDHLTWVPVRAYTAAQGGLPPPSDAPDEVYPLTWEIPVDAVYFNDAKLPRSMLSPSSISLSALLDTGNSLIRGPKDVVKHMMSQFDEPDYSFDCSVAHNLSFVIGGVTFSVDPRDFAVPMSANSTGNPRCTPAVVATDPPGNGGFLYSWSLGDPFLKSALVAYYYGNLTHPSQDPPRVGLLSTVPGDASMELQRVVQAAGISGGQLPATWDVAPSGTFAATATDANGVPQAT